MRLCQVFVEYSLAVLPYRTVHTVVLKFVEHDIKDFIISVFDDISYPGVSVSRGPPPPQFHGYICSLSAFTVHCVWFLPPVSSLGQSDGKDR